jgi:uncharacterized protein (TIGR02594 family)
MFDRRTLLLAAGALSAGSTAAYSQNNDATTADILKSWDFAPATPLNPAISTSATGLAPARNEEVATAFRLLFRAPRNKAPIEVAQYFEAITEKNANGNPYTYEWPTPGRANPMIVGFFSMTNTLPSEGDQTSWCAAFVNFCLAVAEKKLTGSALSGSFRNYSTQTNDPKPGDIVVFREPGDRGNQGFGHVGFFLSRDANGVEVLGGNQRGATGSTGAVTRTKFSFNGSPILHSYRSVV